jgi:Gly-Xaa carboxypeptidase
MRVPVILTPILATGAVSRSVSFLGQTPIGDQQISNGKTVILDAPGADVCPLPPKVAPPKDGLHSSLDFIQDSSYRSKQVERLSRVVQVPSTSTELEDDPWSDYYAPFLDLHDELAKLFPLVYVNQVN